MQTKKLDAFLKKKLEEEEQWIAEGKIAFSSKVIPVHEAIEARQWVLPTEQVVGILRHARSIALKDCLCRSHYRRCDNPLEVCLFFNEAGDDLVAKGIAHHVSFEKAVEVLRHANEKGLVHLSFHLPGQEMAILCSCCPCCCYELQLVREHNRRDLMVRSDYVAVTDMDACTHCGICIERCIFGSRMWKDEQLHNIPEACYGCGLCVTTCPVDAVVMTQKPAS